MVIQQKWGRVNESGEVVDVIHLETDSDMVKVSGTSETLTTCLSELQNGTGVALATADRVVVTDANKKLSASTVKVTELGYLSGVTSALQTQLNSKSATNHNHSGVYIPQTTIGANGGIVPLGTDGKIAAQYLPSYVDDVVEGVLNTSGTSQTFTITGESSPCIPESGKLYIDISDPNAAKSYRWSGSAFVAIGGGVALGETASTAYRGDRGVVAYNHSQAAHARTDATKTAASTTNGKIKINDADVTVYTHPSVSVSKTTPSTSKAHGATIPAVTGVTVDSNGHVTAVATTTYTLTGYAAASHNHDTAYAAKSHNHDTAYASKTHTHTAADVGALATTGGTVTGKTTYKGGLCITRADQNNSLSYFLGIKAFADGGDVQWIAREQICACIGAATSGHTHSYAAASHNHSASNITSGTLALARGGTGGTTAAAARTNLGVINIQVSASQPTNQAAGDLWFQTL